MRLRKILFATLVLHLSMAKAFSFQERADSYDSLLTRSLLDSASNLTENAKYNEALQLYETVHAQTLETQQWETYIEAFRGVGVNNFKLGNYKLALKNRLEMIEIASTYLPKAFNTIAMLYNDLALSYSNSGDYDGAIGYSKKALILQLRHNGEHHANTSQIITDLGSIFNQQSEIDSALKYHQWSLDIRSKMLGKNDPSLANSLSNVGTLYAQKGDYAKQAEYYEKALKIFLENYGEEHPNVATLYNNLAYAFRKKQDYDKQLLYYEKSLALRLKIFGQNHPSVAESYHNISGHYVLQGNFEKFLHYAQKSQRIYVEFYSDSHIKVASSYHMMGVGYERNGYFVKALEYYEKSVEIYKAKFGDQHPTLAARYNNIAACYAGLKQWDKQKEFLEKALKIRIKSLGPSHVKVASVYNNLGKHALNVGDFEMALIQFRSALTSASDLFLSSMDSISDLELSRLNAKDLPMNILRNRAAAFDSLYDQTQDTVYLTNVLADLKLAIRIADLVRFEISGNSSRQKVTKETMPVYEGAIRATFRLYEITQDEEYLKQALSVSEQSKVFQLRLTLQDLSAKQFANVPDSLLKIESNLKSNIAYLEKILDRAKLKRDSSKISQLKDKLWSQKNSFSKHVILLEEEYPNYYELKFNQDVASLESIRENITDSESMLVEYFFGEHSLYVFQITQTNFEVSEIPVNSTLNSTIANYIKATSDYNFIWTEKEASDELYIKSSYLLYNLVLKACLDFDNDDITNLIIAPDGILNTMNFDALLTDSVSASNPNYRTLPYLVKDFQISYTYSASFLQTDFVSSDSRTNNFAGFAPLMESTDHLPEAQVVPKSRPDLPASREEVSQINDLMRGDAWFGSAATEGIFKQGAGDYNIVHLATHGQLDDRNPLHSELFFALENDSTNDGRLSISEIYTMNLNAQLVVLSACNTGQGKVLKGEGIKSLSQAFSYAGCPSVIMSLWKVPDSQTRDLMIELYAGLSQGLSKDAALRMAKLNYFNATADPIYSHPFYWSSFALMGKREAITTGFRFKKWIFLPIFLLILLAIIPKVKRQF